MQRIGIRGVAGLGALGLRHLELVEQHHLQLLGRAQVDLLTDRRVGRLGGVANLVGELALQPAEQFDVDGDAGVLHLGEGALYRKLHLPEQRQRVDLGEFHVERVGQIADRRGTHDQRLDRGVVDLIGVVEQRKLLLLFGFRP